MMHCKMLSLILNLLIVILLYIHTSYSRPTIPTSPSSPRLYISTTEGKEAAELLLDGKDYKFEGRKNDYPIQYTTILHQTRNKGKVGRPMTNPNSLYQKKKANKIRKMMKIKCCDEKTAEKIVLSTLSKERSLAYILKPKNKIQEPSNPHWNEKHNFLARTKTDLNTFENRLNRNIKKGMNEDQAVKDAKEYVVRRKQQTRIARKKYNAKERRLKIDQLQKDANPKE